MKILLGSDPEMFVFKDGEPISAHGMIEGTKQNPFLVKDGAVQVDGMALEYNTNPASTLAEWEANHKSVQKQMLGLIEKGLTLEALPTAFFAEEVFNTAPEEALILGCEPDYNAWTREVNPKPDGEVKFRTGAGHIHIGWIENAKIDDPFHLNECYALTKMLDLWLGMPSVVMDKDDQRRKLYGAAGCFRPKSYGLEYRTLSNFWIKTPELRAWAYKNTMSAIDYAMDADNGSPFWAQNIINDNNKQRAQYYAGLYNVPLLEMK